MKIFVDENIPHITFTKYSFYKRKEIVDLVEYLKVFIDPDSMNAQQLKRLSQRPLRFISNKALDMLQDFAFEYDKNLWE